MSSGGESQEARRIAKQKFLAWFCAVVVGGWLWVGAEFSISKPNQKPVPIGFDKNCENQKN
jgi:hypothetical protein